jgi:splicing factor 3B subunit 2
MYYEGKEYEIIKSDFKPGRLSPALRLALGINETSPPPWLYNMQRFGPPPAYPSLKIPGVNMVVSLNDGGTRFF